MDSTSVPVIAANVERFSGFAQIYDAHRPRVPCVFIDLVTQLARMPCPARVVDLGSGTGLSTFVWTGRAQEVIGVEPNGQMRHQAELGIAQVDSPTRVRFVDAHAGATGLDDASSNIVVCSQSLHWMEPNSTFAEVARILRPGGVFAAIDCDWPPTMDWEAQAAYAALGERIGQVERRRATVSPVRQWDKARHLTRMQSSGRFRWTSEVVLHSVEHGNAARLVGIALSQGRIQSLFKAGVSEPEIGLDQFRAAAHQLLGDQPRPWWFSYRVRVGIR